MRKLSGVLLIVAAPIAALLAVLFLLAAAGQKVMAEIEANDLSAVASDLMSPKELAKQRAAAAKRKKKTRAAKRGARQTWLAYALLGAALAQLLAGVLALLGRARRFAFSCMTVAVAALAATLALERFSVLAAVCGGLTVAALALALVRWRGPIGVATAGDDGDGGGRSGGGSSTGGGAGDEGALEQEATA